MGSSRQYCLFLRGYIHIYLILAMATCPGSSFVIPSEQNKSTLSASRHCRDQGRCPPNTIWSLIVNAESRMATCCPHGYKAVAGPANQIQILTTFFCCPENTENLPCSGSEREITSAPETCPCNSTGVGSQCVGGDLGRPTSAVGKFSLPDIWALLGALLLVILV